ncbi:tRNA (guanine(37)-N1)-methyltransferase Trm5b [uncultured archaeon]|nr:tRNA (guanine(37)-N1)-methyltransferase Trm5b [uncultured archaeon]
MADYDILGNIAIIKGEGKTKEEKLKEAEELMKRASIKTVLEKATNVHGRLRTIKTKHLLGKKTLVAEHRENTGLFKFNVENCYFSPRLSNERQLISGKIKSKDKVLVMFAGVGVYPIVIYKYSKPAKIIGVELGKECCKYFKENLKLNKIPLDKVEVIQGDVKKKINEKFIKENGKFEVVVMARPNLKETFLKQGLIASKKGTRLFYYGFCKDDEIKRMTDELEKEANKNKRKIKIEKIIPAGEIAPYKHRYRVEINVIK